MATTALLPSNAQVSLNMTPYLNNIQVGDTVLLTHDYIPQLGNGMNDQVVHLQKGQMVFIDIMDRRHRRLIHCLKYVFCQYCNEYLRLFIESKNHT